MLNINSSSGLVHMSHAPKVGPAGGKLLQREELVYTKHGDMQRLDVFGVLLDYGIWI